jgi:hypothetical protein
MMVTGLEEEEGEEAGFGGSIGERGRDDGLQGG